MDNLVLIAATMGLIMGALGFYYAKGANFLFLLALGGIGYAAISHIKSTGEINELSTGIGESLTTELIRKLGWVFEVFDRLPELYQSSILAFIAAFFFARILAGVASTLTAGRRETQKTRRKRALKEAGYKNMKEVRRLY